MTELGPAQRWMTDRRHRRRWWTPAVLTQLVVVVATLGAGLAGAATVHGRDGGRDVLSIVQAASASTAGQPTLHAAFVMRLSGAGFEVATSADELIDQVRSVSTGTLQAPTLGSLKLVSGNGFAYVQLPDGRADAAGHHWLALRAPRGAASLSGQDPLAFLKLIADPKDVTRVGTDAVQGVDCTHYTVALDATRLGDLVAKGGSGVSVPSGTFEQVTTAGIQLWIDHRNLVRRMDVQMAIGQMHMSMRLDLSDYGRPVDVQLPSTGDVSELSSPMQLGQALAGTHASSG
jgi:hypothetical protein